MPNHAANQSTDSLTARLMRRWSANDNQTRIKATRTALQAACAALMGESSTESRRDYRPVSDRLTAIHKNMRSLMAPGSLGAVSFAIRKEPLTAAPFFSSLFRFVRVHVMVANPAKALIYKGLPRFVRVVRVDFLFFLFFLTYSYIFSL